MILTLFYGLIKSKIYVLWPSPTIQARWWAGQEMTNGNAQKSL